MMQSPFAMGLVSAAASGMVMVVGVGFDAWSGKAIAEFVGDWLVTEEAPSELEGGSGA